MNCNGTHAFPQKNPLCDEVLSLYEEKLQEVEEQITALDAVRSRLHERIATFKWMKTTSSSHNADADPSPAKAEKPWESADELNTLP
jgi:hypothetical protein